MSSFVSSSRDRSLLAQVRAACRLAAAVLAIAAITSVARGHGALDDKIRELTQALLAEPENARVRFELAAVHQEHGDWLRALALLDRVEELAPEQFSTGLVRGQALASGGRFPDARAVLDEFIQSNQQHVAARLARARVLSELGENVAAAADAAMAMAASPEPDAELLLALADYHVAAKQNGEALAILDAARQKFGPLPLLTQRAVGIELALGRNAQAVGRIEEAIAATAPRERAPWLADKARLHAQLGQSEAARQTWQALLEFAATLPPLDRGTPALLPLLAEADRALAPARPSPTISLAPPIPPPAPAP